MHDCDTMPAYDTGGTLPTIEYLPATAPAYARTLEERALRAEAALAALNDSLGSLRAYVSSAKFTPTDGSRHGYVNVADIWLRLDEADSAAMHADADASNAHYRATVQA